MTDSDIILNVNGQEHALAVPSHRTLLDVLRDELDLTGAKRGCDRGECGACTVLLDGKPVYACITLVGRVGGRSVLTVEGLAADDRLDPIQQAFLDEDGAQCGYCTPGFLLSTYALLADNPTPTDNDIRGVLSGNLCRCNAYGRILQSVRTAAERG